MDKELELELAMGMELVWDLVKASTPAEAILTRALAATAALRAYIALLRHFRMKL